MTKVVRIYLISEVVDKNGNNVDYKDVCDILWTLQRQTRDIKNKSVQLCWEWLGFSSDYKRQTDTYPKDKDVLNYTLSGYVYDKTKEGHYLNSANSSTSTRDVCTAFKNAQKEMLQGTKSILSYKADQPLDLHNKTISLSYDGTNFHAKLSLLNQTGMKLYNIKQFDYRLVVKEKSARTILERCIDGVYKVSGSKLIYDRKKRMWCLNLSYSFEKEVSPLDKDKILGVDLGVVYPICASVHGDLNRLIIKGGEIEEFRKRVEARRIQLLEQTKYCGDGRIGHGRKKRIAPAFRVENVIANFRDTTNHKYSRALIEFAKAQGCGTIQLEKLTGISSQNAFLKNWSYFDLQAKIEYKAKEEGIDVVYIDPKFTSQRCSKCGHIDADNRPEQAKFCCTNCGFSANADFNASQNISIKNIDKIIAAQLDKQNT